MKRFRVAIIGHGKLGRACEQAMADCAELELAGIARRGEHIRELRAVHMEAGLVGAFIDAEVQAAAALPRDTRPLYLIPVGRPRQKRPCEP